MVGKYLQSPWREAESAFCFDKLGSRVVRCYDSALRRLHGRRAIFSFNTVNG